MKIIDFLCGLFGVDTEDESCERVDHDVVMVNVDGVMVEVTEDDSEVRKKQ